MTIKQLGGVFGRNPTFNDVTIDGELILNGEIFTGLDFQGSWNAAANTPTLASGVGTTGEFYIVSVAGTTNLDGITNWGVGDWAMFSGSAWQRVEGNADGNFVNLSVTGTATMGELSVDGNATISSVTPRLNLMESDTTDLNSALLVSGGNFSIRTQSDANALTAVRLNIDNATGDISFREDTGTTPKFFWDASAESLGLGTTIPGQKLEIKESSTGAGDAIIRLRGDGNNANNTPLGSLEWFNTDSSGPQPGVVAAVEAQSANANGHMGKLLFKTHDGSGSEADPPTTRMIIDESGNLGIGSSSPAAKLDVVRTGAGIQDTLQLRNEQTLAAGVGSSLGFGDSGGARLAYIAGAATGANNDNGYLSFYTRSSDSLTEKMTIDSSGIGIGTSSPDTLLHLSGDATSIIRLENTNAGLALNSVIGSIEFEKQDGSGAGAGVAGSMKLISSNNNGAESSLVFSTCSTARGNNAEAMRIDANGSVGISTSSPSSFQAGAKNLVIGSGSGHQGMTIYSGTASRGNIYFADGTTSSEAFRGQINYFHDADYLRFVTSASEKARLDSDGNFLVGTTDNNPVNNGTDTSADDGVVLGAAGSIAVARYNNTPMFANRTGDNGAIIDFRKSGVPIGSLGANADTILQASSASSGGFFVADNFVNKFGFLNGENALRPASDNAITLGKSDRRFVDLYLAGGVVFGATGGAVTSKTLNDYEEGTFTPEIADASSGGNTGSATTVEGYYTKVGRLVTIAIALVDIDTTGMTLGNNLYVRGLPFSQGAGEDHGSARVNAVTFSGSLSTYCTGTYALVADSTSGTSFGYVSVGDCTSGNADIYMGFTYRTT